MKAKANQAAGATLVKLKRRRLDQRLRRHLTSDNVTRVRDRALFCFPLDRDILSRAEIGGESVL
jgi:hypothetical protein